MNDQARVFKVPPLEKRIQVRCEPARAFAAFTEEIARWWPLATHSVAQENSKACAIEPWLGGRVFETDALGNEHLWGRITRWQPPFGFAMTWHPGRGPETAQRVSLRFAAQGEGTLVTLIHDGWEALTERAENVRASYDQGWEKVLGGDYLNYAECNQGARSHF
jgi:hypothetical protein